MFCTVTEALKGLTQGLCKNAQMQATVNYSCLSSLHFVMFIINTKPCLKERVFLFPCLKMEWTLYYRTIVNWAK